MTSYDVDLYNNKWTGLNNKTILLKLTHYFQ